MVMEISGRTVTRTQFTLMPNVTSIPLRLERVTFVALLRDRLVAAAHLRRYGTDSRVMPDFYDAGEIKWLIGWPHRIEAAHAPAKACIGQLEKWGVKRQRASGDLRTPAAFGIPTLAPGSKAGDQLVGRSEIRRQRFP